MITFKEAISEGQMFIISPGCKTENSGYFTNCRVDKNTIPFGWHAYDIREDGYGNFCSVEPKVFVNHGGTFLTEKEIRFPKRKSDDLYLSLRGRGGYTFA